WWTVSHAGRATLLAYPREIVLVTAHLHGFFSRLYPVLCIQSIEPIDCELRQREIFNCKIRNAVASPARAGLKRFANPHAEGTVILSLGEIDAEIYMIFFAQLESGTEAHTWQQIVTIKRAEIGPYLADTTKCHDTQSAR